MKELQIPIMVYSFFLALMAAISSGVSKTLGLGGFIFALSDLLISFGEAKMDFSFRNEIVSFTYVVAQYLLTKEWSKIHSIEEK